MRYRWILVAIILGCLVDAKIHLLTLTDDSRRNIPISKFGYNVNGTLDFKISNFTIPDLTEQENIGDIGFTLSRTNIIAEDIHSNPHICQLQQHDQGMDALFFIINFSINKIMVTRSGALQNLKLCTSSSECPSSVVIEEKVIKHILLCQFLDSNPNNKNRNFFQTFWKIRR